MNDRAPSDQGGAVDRPVVWQDDTLPGAIWMRGVASEYRVDPVDEYVIGVPIGLVGYDLHHRSATRRVQPGELVVLDPEHTHTGTRTTDGPWHAQLLVLPAALLWSTLDRPPSLIRVTVDGPVIRAPTIRNRFLALHAASERGSPTLERECALVTLLDALAGATDTTPRPSGDPVVALAVDYLRDCSLEPVDLDTLAAAVGTTKFRLLRRFRAEVGITPHQYLLSIRIAHARRLLAVGTPISEAAADTGFADQSHLTRRFRSRLGMTPGHYRDLTSTRASRGHDDAP